MQDVIIIGTGGHAKVIADIIFRSGDNLIGFLTSDVNKKEYLGRPVLGNDTEYRKFPTVHFIIAIGNSLIRERIAKCMEDALWYRAIHPSAVISSIDVEIGLGTVVMANAVINAGAKVGNHCIINSGATVEHDGNICDYVHVSVGTTLAGNVHVGKHTWVGAGATVSNGITICDSCMIGAGAVVVKEIAEPGTYVGVPCKKIK